LAFVVAYPFVATASLGAVYLYIQMTGRTPEPIAHHSLQAIVQADGDPWAWVIACAAVVGAPIAEEIIYRVFLTGMLLRLGCPPWPAILACSTLFAFSHYGSVPWYAMIPLGVLGAAMGIAYERTKRLGVPIIMHACFNALNVAFAIWLT
jgi:membrane protease YdiL (CAAX protease family)